MSREKLSGAKNLLLASLAVDVAATTAVGISDIWAVNVLNGVSSGTHTPNQSTLDTLDALESLPIAPILTQLGVGVFLLRWLDACYEYATRSLKAAGLAQARWTLWGWIVPFINLYKPYQVLSEIYRVSSVDNRGGEDWKESSGSWLLLAWWILWVITHLVMWNFASRAIRDLAAEDLALGQVLGMQYLSLALCGMSLAIAGLWCIVASQLTRRLIDRHLPAEGRSTYSVTRPGPGPGHGAAAARAPHAELSSATEPYIEIDEDRVFAEIAEEFELGIADKGLWTRLFAESDGDERKTKVLYIKQRAERLIVAERSRLRQIDASNGRQAHESTQASVRPLPSLERDTHSAMNVGSNAPRSEAGKEDDVPVWVLAASIFGIALVTAFVLAQIL